MAVHIITRTIAATATGIALLAGCAGEEKTGFLAPSKDDASSAERSIVRSATPSSTATTRPASPLTPEGFGASPPTMKELLAFGDWMDGPGKGARAATDTSSEGMDEMNEAIEARSPRAVRIACRRITDPLVIRLPASLPTPDPDLTNAFEFLVDDGAELASACSEFGDPPTDAQLVALGEALEQLGTDLRATGTILQRNGDLLLSAAEGS